MPRGGPQLQPTGQCLADQQQCGDELGAARGVDEHLVALLQCAGVHGEGQHAGGAGIFDPGTQGFQCVEHRGHRAHAGCFVAIECHAGTGNGGQRRNEAHDGAGQAAVDGQRAGGQLARDDGHGGGAIWLRGAFDADAESG